MYFPFQQTRFEKISLNPIMSHNVYTKSLLQSKVVLDMAEIGSNVADNLVLKIERKVGGRCNADGYIQPKSVELVSHSSGNVMGEYVEFHVVYFCNVCFPLEDMELDCVCKTVTKAGIHAQVVDEHGNVPITVFVARDLQAASLPEDMPEGEPVKVRVLGQRFELNDDSVCVIADLIM
jgi:hypothetical protein